MKYFIYLMLFPILFSAQTNRFIYEVNFKKDSIQNVITNQFYHLDLSEGKSSFYHRDYFILDSMRLAGSEMSMDVFGGQPNMSNVIKHDLKTNKFQELELMEYQVFEIASDVQQEWNLKEETKVFQNLTLQKAETIWAGRKWVAWFAKSIPINSGPHKFYGLPGLIIELKDDLDNFKYQLVKSENYSDTKNVSTLEFFEQIVPVNFAKYKKKKLSIYNDPLAFIKTTEFNLDNSGGIYLQDGTIVKADNIREVQILQQKRIKRFNNPVELDKIIVYPMK